VAAVEGLLQRANDHLVRGEFPEARAIADEAFAASPADPKARELYANVYLAHGIRLAGLARETRRREIDARGTPGQVFEDSVEVQGRFREVLAAFDRVLAVDPDHVKAHSLKAQAMFRLDRANREAALAAYDQAAAALERTVPAGSPDLEVGRRNLSRDRRRIERPCEWCDDTGFCTECHGSGWRTIFRLRRRCEACLGHGTCKRCGVL
jgi:tetratricopeptide (TPR) repeat protein